MKVGDLRNSRFLTKEEVSPPKRVTIVDCKQLNVALDSEPPELKWCLIFKETKKPMVLNHTNGQLLEAELGSDDSKDWLGKQIVLWNDPSVGFGGKRTGGIRVKITQQVQEDFETFAEANPVEGDDFP